MPDSSIDHTLDSIRKVMRSPKKKESADEILELTEDDLVDEEDQEAFVQEREESIEQITSFSINDFLTQLPHSSKKENNLSQKIEEEFSSAKDAAKSLANIKKMIKDAAPASNMQGEKTALLENLVIEALRPMLKEWLDQNLDSIVREVLNEKLSNLNLKNFKYD